jgi:hypothetical protein
VTVTAAGGGPGESLTVTVTGTDGVTVSQIESLARQPELRRTEFLSRRLGASDSGGP